MNRLVLIDGHAILHRAYHALPPLTTAKGQLINAAFGFTSMLLRVISDLKPTHLAVAFDRPKPTFRKKLFVNYQAQRPKMADELSSQIETVHKVLNEMQIPIFELDGYEADDLLGTIAQQVKSSTPIRSGSKLKVSRLSGIYDAVNTHRLRRLADGGSQTASGQSGKIEEVVIVTGDRDILQLIDNKVKVYMPVKGLSESKLYGEKEVEEKFGVKPTQIVDYKALTGDPSDNYLGVAGVGPKTASLLLQRFETLEQIYKHIKDIDSEKVRKALEVNIESANLAKQLATIVTNVPIRVDLEKCKLGNLDRPNVHSLFEEMEFRTLIPRLGKGAKVQRSKDTKYKEHRTKNIEQKKQDIIQQTKLF